MYKNITIVTSTRNKDENFVKMLNKTIGLKDTEILIYENNGEYSLTEIYNKGLNESRNDIVVFLHDDIIIETNSWGKKLLDYYNNTNYGILGVAGTNSLDSNGCWWTHPNSMMGIVKHTDGDKTWTNTYSKLSNEINEAIVVDGVFFSACKDRLKENFNEEVKGFHFYDVDFCFRNFIVGVGVGVHTNILILHKSVGQTNKQWENNRIDFSSKYSDKLPVKLDIEVPYFDINKKLKFENKVGIIIPTKNNVDTLLIPCINSILGTTNYSNFKIYIADTGSSEHQKNLLKHYIENINYGNKIKLIEYDYYNFAKINNDVVKNHIEEDTELLLFCNNDIELVNDAMTLMVDAYQKSNGSAGTIGCRLHYGDGTIQHMGMLFQLNKNGNIRISHRYLGWNYRNIVLTSQNNETQGNTAAFMLINKNLFHNAGEFNETYEQCFEDVELNMKCTLRNKKNITVNNAVAYHLESQTRKPQNSEFDYENLVGFIERNSDIKKTFYLTN